MAATSLVIFDFDGVLANSEIIALAELSKALARYEIHVADDELISRFLGASFADIAAFANRCNGACDKEVLRKSWHDALFARYARELTLMPGASDLLDGLDAVGVRYCIASGSATRRLGFALNVLGIAKRFEKTAFSVDMVAAGKPAPDLFLHAAKTMDAPADSCLVIEDATAGAEAARAAGMRCIGFVGGDHLAARRRRHAVLLAERGAKPVVEHLTEVLKHLDGND